ALLTAAKGANGLEGVIAPKQQPAEEGAQRLLWEAEGILQLGQDGLGRIEVRQVLVVIAHRDPGSGLHPAPVRAELAEQRLEQAGLARPIGPDDGDTFSRADREGRDREPPA